MSNLRIPILMYHSISENGNKIVHPKELNILMMVENYFPSDTRVRREANTLKELYNITVISLKRDSEEFHEVIDGIEVFRLPALSLPKLKSKFLPSYFSKINYIFQYFFFTFFATSIFLITHLKKRYKLIHVHNPPDTLFIPGLLGKLLGIKFVFDHHDLSPELYLTRFSGKKDIVYKILVMCEKISCKLADVVISTNNSYKEIAKNRHNIAPDRIYIVRNNPIVNECLSKNNNFNYKIKDANRKVLLFLGSINPQDGVDVLLKSLLFLVNEFKKKNFICHIIGDGDSLHSIKQLTNELNLTEYINFTGYITEREKIKEYLNLADICVEPAPYNELNKHSTFIKIMEYMASGKPIVAFDLKETRFSADGAALLVSPGDIKGFACAINKLLEDPELSRMLGNVGLNRVTSELTWERASQNLLEVYKSLLL